ncbi:YusW family protein [Bacillus sp. FJAT-50079]|uniref:YusW family protein n=1 Tax=Bacillus sp. FJAT-50079 TaxID=2833577 RepID=UPI001BC9C56F|nr:YusW family protein [Bacillus sp. FJAT-50079]MBS4208806.1 YusW family protein [Bacillus sp. FJAT-50079]
MLKKLSYTFASFALLFGLVACSNDPSVDNNPKEQMDGATEPKTPDNQSVTDSGVKSNGNVNDPGATDQMADLDFIKFDLEVKYGPNKKYDVEYEQKDPKGVYEAELEDDINGQMMKGADAFNGIYNVMKDVSLTANTPQTEVIQTILNAFQLAEDYTEFDLDYTTKDGTKIDIEDKK